ncbi:hypothetical protein, partial [Bradyrhizobium sp.]|uniref:hypothetical protein n=1 Tax=Bradyrhizobium sp. TaxID=376 RepID=UPI003C3D0DAE
LVQAMRSASLRAKNVAVTPRPPTFSKHSRSFCRTRRTSGCRTRGGTQATISIARSNDLLYLAAPASVELNGAKIASIGKGETFTGGIAPGPAVVTVSAWATPGSTSYSFVAEPGKTYRFTVAPRGANFAVGLAGGIIGMTGQAIEGGGPFQIAPAT